MIRIWTLSLAAILGVTSLAPAQVFVRAPFVRVYADGPYWHVRAPFVNIGSLPYSPAEPVPVAPLSQQPPKGQPGVPAVPTIQEFARTFQATPGSHEATVINPATNAPTTVRFILPAGTPRRVLIRQDSIEFDYGFRQFVRIEFDRDGATVVSR